MAKKTNDGGATASLPMGPTEGRLPDAPAEHRALAVEDAAGIGITGRAAEAQARILAQYALARRFPRNIDDCRVSLLRECARTRFAEAARYLLPRGAGVTGWTIRFAEAAVRVFGNIEVLDETVHDDDEKRVVRISCTDRETLTTFGGEVTVGKVVERRKKPADGAILGERITSRGDVVYLVRATEDDLRMKTAAHISRAIRTHGLRLIPADILEDCLQMVTRTLDSDAERNPDELRKRVADAFAALSVPPSEIEEALGVKLAQATPAQLTQLRQVYTALKEGQVTWGTVRTTASKMAAEGTLDLAAIVAANRAPESGGDDGATE